MILKFKSSRRKHKRAVSCTQVLTTLFRKRPQLQQEQSVQVTRFNDGVAKFVAIPKELYPFISIPLIGETVLYKNLYSSPFIIFIFFS